MAEKMQDEGDGIGTNKGIYCYSLLLRGGPTGACLPDAKTICNAKI